MNKESNNSKKNKTGGKPSVIGVFIRSMKVIKKNISTLFLASFIFVFIVSLLSFLGQDLIEFLVVSYLKDLFSLTSVILFGLAGLLTYLLVITVPTIGMINVSLAVLRNEADALSSFYKDYSLVSGLFLAHVLKYLFLFLIFAGSIGASISASYFWGTTGIIFGFLVFIAGIILGTYFFIRLYFYDFFLVDQRLSPLTSLKKSFEDTANCPVFTYLIFLGFISMAFYLLGAPLYMIGIEPGLVSVLLPVLVSLLSVPVSFISGGCLYQFMNGEKELDEAVEGKILIGLLLFLFGMMGLTFFSYLEETVGEEEFTEEEIQDLEERMEEWEGEIEDFIDIQ